MKICVAQTKAAKGDILRNIENHKKVIELAVFFGTEVVIFPELSLTGYEPTLAKELAASQDDPRLDQFQIISDTNAVTIGVGMPTKSHTGICISMILFQPKQPRQMYSKKYLHPDEEKFFCNGQGLPVLINDRVKISLAICYEISIPEHAENAFKNEAKIYIASVAKFVNGIDKALKRLSETAQKYSMTVLMANCIGESDGNECAGKTSIWNSKGLLVGQLDGTHEGILIVDTDTNDVVEKML